jgi:hypothetical protein
MKFLKFRSVGGAKTTSCHCPLLSMVCIPSDPRAKKFFVNRCKQGGGVAFRFAG